MDRNKSKKNKLKYEKPSLKSEELTAIAALCNGVSTGGRKASVPTCNASRLKS